MMNPTAVGLWNNPPPPGLEDDSIEEDAHVNNDRNVDVEQEADDRSMMMFDESINFKGTKTITDYPLKRSDYDRTHHHHHRRSSKRNSRSRSRDRFKSRSRERKKRRHRSRSRGRRHRRTSRSRSRGAHRRKYSSSRSRSRSSSSYERSRHRHSKRDKRRRSRSRRYTRSRSRSSGSYRRGRSRRFSRDREIYCNPYPPEDLEDKDDDDDTEEPAKELPFKNDGTFLEMFKKMQEEQQQERQMGETSKTETETKKPLPVFGKRRGGRVLKTGLVQKSKNNQQDDTNDVQDPWSIYLKEVKRYKEACCDDDSKTRPLVK